MVLRGLFHLMLLVAAVPAAACDIALVLAVDVSGSVDRHEYSIQTQGLAEGLRDGNGRLLCRMDQIAGVDRGAFAFKPSNGFLVKLKEPMPRVWQPGLWWRLGRRIGVGGVTPAGQGKFMADMIALKLRGDHDLFAERK